MRRQTCPLRYDLPIHVGVEPAIRAHSAPFVELCPAILTYLMSNISSSIRSTGLSALTVVFVGLFSACSSDTESVAESADATAVTTVVTTADMIIESTNDSLAKKIVDPWTTPGENMRGLRYCELLFLTATESGLTAEVYNTYPLNDCPSDQWATLDPAAIAIEAGVPLALANGPRYWLMDSVRKSDQDSIITKVFGGLAMNRYAQVVVGKPESVGVPYTPQSVDRKSTFAFAAGQMVFVLVTPEGLEYIMQSWSQQRDPALSESDLANLGSRLQLPDGWRFESRVLDQELVVDTSNAPARVLQDELLNSYSLIP